MYLKSIEIQGFKSFAKKTTLEFKNGITGIVGPNGSGKSNVADALRWVLGEQKVKSLRGSKMEDVIFAGTEKRNPLSFAYVAITFDNSDRQLSVEFSEVKVARKLYRSGESEYLLNGSPVRLKDIRELFYDTGIGKEGYSIIGQGQIDKILAGKSEERRALFDEACKIVKYKNRKAIALKKLENERLNLERTSDIAGELEKRLGPLKRQSNTAKNFIDHKNELKVLDINLFLYENDKLKEKINECREKESSASDELSEASAQLLLIKEEHEKAASQLAALDSETEELSLEISRSNIIKENLTGQINVLNEQINSARRSQEHYSERKEALKASIDQARAEKNSLEEDQAANKALLDEIRAEKDQKEKTLLSLRNEIASLNEELDSLKEDLIENIQKNGQEQAKLERVKTGRRQLEDRRNSLKENKRQLLESSKKQEEITLQLSVQSKEHEDKVNTLEKEAAEKAKEISCFERESEVLNRQISSLTIERTKALARLESVRNITERYEGYSGAIREVMALKNKNKGIIGVVADIIKTSEKYETAIETALGGNIQNIVTDNESTAKEAIEYLKKNRSGRATFLPLAAIKSRSEFKNEQALNEEGAIGLASSLVYTENRFKDLNNFLLGRILVVDTIDHALKIARKYRYSFIMVTLEGELLSRGGALSGGAYKSRSNLLGRRREIEELEKEIASCLADLKSVQGKLDIISKDKASASEQLAMISTQLQEEKILLNTVNINLSRARDDEAGISAGLENAEKENRAAALEEDKISVLCDEILKEIERNEEENERIKADISRLDEALKAKKADEALAVSASGNTDSEFTRLKEQQSFIISSLIKAENNLEKLTGDLNALETSCADSVSGIEAKKTQIKEIEDSIKRADEEIAALSLKLAARQDMRTQAKSEGDDFLIRHDELSERIFDLDKEVFRLGQMREKYEEQFNSKADHIWNEYELTYSNAKEYKDASLTDAAQIKERISVLRSKIRALGTINTAAIDEYREVKERYDFLSGQIEDIKKAEDDILRMIRDLDRQMKERFNTEFEKISAEFSRVFRIMFGGGTGTLALTDEGNILESDIDIIAQPPGKKLQNMMQLSGGEKALTAIAVLFAIQNLKPSPFCILDEIEAALDDSNISRFSNYLMLLSGKIQFIVITHRKGTMEVCDRLYGITMQEKGLSSLVSVSLEEAEKTMSEEEKKQS